MADRSEENLKTPVNDRNNNSTKKSTGKKRKARERVAAARTRRKIAEENKECGTMADKPITVAMLKQALKESNEDLEGRLENNIKRQIDSAIGTVSASVGENTKNIEKLSAEVRDLKKSLSEDSTRTRIEEILEERRIQSPT